MADEIEVKYLVKKMPVLEDDINSEKIVQAYLHRSHGPDETKAFIDIKIIGDKSFIFIEGKEIKFPQAVYKYEIPVKDLKNPLKDANEILGLIGLSGAKEGRLNNTSITVRLRRLGNVGLITLKGERVGITVPEYEYELPLDEVVEMFNICEPGILDKTRYYIPHGEFVIELDVFGGKNTGLILAEVEFKKEADLARLVAPSWFGKDVSKDSNYTNAALSR